MSGAARVWRRGLGSSSPGSSHGGCGGRLYLSKLPRFEKKFRVALDWTLDLLFHKDLVQFQTLRTKGVSHKEAGPLKSEKPTG